MFVHLRAHSSYSFLESLASPAELVQAAVQQGMPALGISEHRGLTGAVEYYDACQSAGIRPILGLEIEANHPAQGEGPLALLAVDLAGWSSLCSLSSALLADSRLPGSISWETLAAHTSGLLCLSGGRAGLVTQRLAQNDPAAAERFLVELGELFPARLYVELQQHTPGDAELVQRLARLAKRLHLPAAATHSIYYISPQQASLQRVLAAIRLNQPLSALSESAAAPPGAAFLSIEEMEKVFTHYPAALEATLEIAGRCKLELPVGIHHYPTMPLPPGVSADQELRRAAHQGACQRYPCQDAPGGLSPEIQDRLDHELRVIAETGYAPLFLIVQEILEHARSRGVPISSRGSAASSLVAHCLGITSPDPVRLNLYFERFLNPARLTPPDIDTDLCSRRRDEVIRFVYERFGAERVAMVCTISTFRHRSALRETAKAYGLPADQVSLLADSLPHRWWGPPGRGDQENSPFEELKETFRSATHQAIFRDAAALLGLPRHLSIHPGGVVITPGELTELVPLQFASKGIVITQFDLESIERLGLLKIDLLGIRGLTVLGDVSEALTASQPERYTEPLAALEGIPEDDPATSQVIQHGRTIGCFQIESPGMRSTLREVQARSVDDLMVALALYRPGPLTGGLKDAFVRRHRGQEAVNHLHPALAPLLNDTYGVILYQEQVLRLAHELGGFSLAEADLLRRAMSHFDPGKQMETLKEKFCLNTMQHSGMPLDTAERVWELMAAFAGYGFPKAHAASYAQVAWRSAWCKTHYPALFMAAVLANWGGYYGQRVYLTEARRLGLTLRPPHINHARAQFSLSYIDERPVLFMGLDQVKDLTRHTQTRIQQQRPFRSLQDFLVRADPRPAEAEALVRCGALDGLGSIPALLSQLKGERRRSGQLSLFGLETAAEDEDDWSLAEKVVAQEEILGASVAAHPLELAAEKIAALHALTTLEAAARLGQKVRVAGMRQTWRRSRTMRNDPVYFMSLEDLEGMLDVVISSAVYRAHRAALTGPGPYVLEGSVQLDNNTGEPFIRAERFERV